MHNIWLIILREYITRVRKKSFILMSLLGPLLMAGIIVFSFWLNLEESENQKILVVDDNFPLYADLKDSKTIDYEVVELSLDKGLALLDASDYTALLYLNKKVLNNHAGQLYFKKTPSFRVQRSIEETIQQHTEIYNLKDFNISETDYRRLKKPFTIIPLKYDGENSTKTDILPAMVGWVFGIVIFMAVFLYSVQVMRGVIEEKTNRIVEVIISTVKPTQLLLGKIIGVGAVGITQFIIWAIVAGTAITVGQTIIMANTFNIETIAQQGGMTNEIQAKMLEENSINLTEFSKDDNVFNSLNRVNFPLMFGMFIFYFLGGYLLYSALMAAVGSAADNDTDTQQFVLPVTLPLMAAYIVSFSMFNNPESDIIVWMSIIPFTSPIIMIMRIAFGIEAGDIWQVYLSMFLLVVTFMIMVWTSAKIYRVGILMYGKKITLKDLVKWIRH